MPLKTSSGRSNKGGTAQLNGVLDGDTVGIVTAVWPGTDLNSKVGDPNLNLATAKPGDYHFQALALYANPRNYARSVIRSLKRRRNA